MVDLTPGEWLSTAVALLALLGGALAAFIRIQIAPLRNSADELRDHLREVQRTLGGMEHEQATHNQAGYTWAKAMYRHLRDRAGHEDVPNPDDYPGI